MATTPQERDGTTFVDWPHHAESIAARRLRTPRYQRPISTTFARKIAREFDPELFLPLAVSRRADGDYVMDGNHRLVAVRDELGWDTTVPCEVYEGLTEAQEIRFYLSQASGRRRQLRALDAFHAAFLGGDAAAHAVVAVVEDAGLQMNWNSSTHTRRGVRAVAMLRRLHDVYGARRLRRVLELLDASFDGDSAAFTADLLWGMMSFYARYEGEVDEGDLVTKLARVGLGEVNRRALGGAAAAGARGHGAGKSFVGRAILSIYNSGKRAHALGEWRENFLPADVEAQRVHREASAGRARRRIALLRDERRTALD